ncbi:otopetrin-3 [Orussus abietinus]|uniref:otopetrin-3 n=1 Tax=Orussus abietinus TaxID=222816 RepID=UPI000625E759|nr:otopetrin-3 [Orussus abietinus]
MVLQLVAPQNTLRNPMQDSEESNLDLPVTPDFSNGEYYSYNNITGHSNGFKGRSSDIRGIKSNYLGRGFNSSGSLRSEAASFQGQYLPSTSNEEKKHVFRCFISIIMSCIYAVFLVTLGIVIYVADILTVNSSLAATFNLYLVLVGFTYLGYLFVDIRRQVGKAKHRLEATTNYDKEDGTSTIGLDVSSAPVPHHGFCFALGRHAGSFYLKVGAAVFCFGHLIHSGLLLVYEVVFLTSEEFYECFSPAALVFDAIYPIYSFFQLFFIFKYSNVIINHCKVIARMLVMHTIASSLCFWVWAIVRESTDSLSRHANAADKEDGAEDSAEVAALVSSDGSASVALPLTSYQERGARDLLKFLNGSHLDHDCQHTELNVIYEWFSPYLYPFTIEYSILIVGVFYIMWNNIGNCRRGGGSSMEGSPCPPLTGPQAGSNIILHADCSHANRGLFGGILILVGSIVSIIIFFIVVADQQYVEIGIFANQITELILLSVMTSSAILAYRQITKLDVNRHAISLLDDILLFVAIPAFFLYAIFSIIPATQKHDILKISSVILGVIQVLIQTPLIIEGLRRCSNSKRLRDERPGRELVTFLVICNVALWIIETFEIKSTDTTDYRYEFYGKVLWTILKHMTVPLTMFYRFHSSVCLVDIWKSAYEPEEPQR